MTAAQTRAAGAVGSLAALFFIVGFVADPTPPVAGASSADVAPHLIAFATADRLAGFFFGAAGALLIAFVAGFRQLVLENASRGSWLATAMLGGAIHAGTLITATSVIMFTLGAEAGSIDPQTAATLSDIANYGFIFAGFGTLVFIAAASALMLTASGVLRVLGELGVVASVLLVVYVITAFYRASPASIPAHTNPSAAVGPGTVAGPFVAGGIVSIICFAVAALWVGLCALAMLTLEPYALTGTSRSTGRPL